jgi:hypothetical protein
MAKPSKTVFTVGEAVVYFSGGPFPEVLPPEFV